MSLRPQKSRKRIAGALCLDFVNTVGEWELEAGKAAGYRPLRDWFESLGDVLAWCREAEAVPGAELDRLARWAARHPAEAQAELDRLRRLREALYRTFRAIAGGRPAKRDDLASLTTELAAFRAGQGLVPAAGGFELGTLDPGPGATSLLGPLVESAVALSSAGDLARVKVCGGEGCGWLFLDLSRTGRRRWCDMKDCGNLAKVRRFRARQRPSAA